MLRILLFGAPLDSSTREALTQAALDMCEALLEQNKASAPAAAACPGSFQALLQVVMWGVASLTYAELLCAVSQLLQFAGQPAGDVRVAELAHQIRQVHSACTGFFHVCKQS